MGTNLYNALRGQYPTKGAPIEGMVVLPGHEEFEDLTDLAKALLGCFTHPPKYAQLMSELASATSMNEEELHAGLRLCYHIKTNISLQGRGAVIRLCEKFVSLDLDFEYPQLFGKFLKDLRKDLLKESS